MEKANILIAEDDAVLREVYVKKFSLAGCKIRTVPNGQEAIAEIEREKPEILILDIHMPIIDGFGVLEKYPREKRDFPIIMLTNFDQDDLKARALELGADDYRMKTDLTMNTLVKLIEGMRKP